MSLEQWRDNTWIREIEPSRQVVSDLLSVAEREIADGGLDGISIDGRFDHAYDAVRCLCEVALHAKGYEIPKGARKHERAIESLKFTLGGRWAKVADFLDFCRRRRHQSIYERAGVVQRQDADDLLKTATDLMAEIRGWLEREYPALA